MKLKKLAASLLAAAMVMTSMVTGAFAAESKTTTVDVVKNWTAETTTTPELPNPNDVTITVDGNTVRWTETNGTKWKGTVELPENTDWNNLESKIVETSINNWELTKKTVTPPTPAVEGKVAFEITGGKVNCNYTEFNKDGTEGNSGNYIPEDTNLIIAKKGNNYYVLCAYSLEAADKTSFEDKIKETYASAEFFYGNESVTWQDDNKTATLKKGELTFSETSVWSMFDYGKVFIDMSDVHPAQPAKIELTNTYKAPDEIKQDVTFTKKFALAEGIDSDHVPQTASFGFQLERIEDNSWPVADQTGFSYGDGKDIEITFKDVPVGTYILRENMGFARDWTTSIPNGVKVFVTKEGVTFGDNHENTLVVTNTYTKTSTIPDTVSISVEKEWSDGNENHENDSITVIVNQKVGDKWIYAGKCAVLSESNGWKYSFDGLFKYKADGKTEIEYTVEEVNVPTGYTVSYDYGRNDDGTEEYDRVVFGDGNQGSVTITNTYIGTVSFTKVFKLENGAKASDVAGHKFTFTLTPLIAELREAGEGNTIDPVTIPYNDAAVVVTFKNVPEGRYILKENMPEGWTNDMPEVVVSVREGGTVYFNNSTNLTVTNTYKKTDSTPIYRDDDDKEEKDAPDLTVKKVDSETGKLITDKATFRIYKESGSRKLYYTGSGWSSKLANAKEYSTKNGKFTAYDLGAGTYYVEEVKAPSGYNLGDDLKVKLTSKDKTVEFANSKVKQNPNTGALVLPVDLADAAVAAMTLGAAAWVISKSKK